MEPYGALNVGPILVTLLLTKQMRNTHMPLQQIYTLARRGSDPERRRDPQQQQIRPEPSYTRLSFK